MTRDLLTPPRMPPRVRKPALSFCFRCRKRPAPKPAPKPRKPSLRDQLAAALALRDQLAAALALRDQRAVREAERVAEHVTRVEVLRQELRLQRVFNEMARVLARYAETQDPEDYDHFRRLKRQLYALTDEATAAAMCAEAAEQAGWDETHAYLRFSKLS